MEKIQFHEIGEKIECNGVLLEVVHYNEESGNTCKACYFRDECLGKHNCSYNVRKDKMEIIYKQIQLTIEDLKPGDFVAFEYNGNTVVTEIVDDGAWFDYAVGLWFDDNLVGENDCLWKSDSLEHVDDPDYPIQNLRYAGLEDVKRFASVVIGHLKSEIERKEEEQHHTDLKTLLVEMATRYETADFITKDPIQFPHRYRFPMDIEISAFVTSWLSFGRRGQITTAARIANDFFSGEPTRYIIKRRFEHLKDNSVVLHRMLTYGDFYDLCDRIYNLYKEYGDIYLYLRKHTDNPVKAISDYFKGVKGIPDYDKGSACKRICMFLRWMVRDGVVDIGTYSFIDKADLIIPLDTHVHQVALQLGITKRKQADMKTAIEITEYFKTVFPDDPARGDFALFGAGINQDELTGVKAGS